MSNDEQHQRKKILETKYNTKLELLLKEVGNEIKTLFEGIAPRAQIADEIEDPKAASQGIQGNFSDACNGKKKINESNIIRLESKKEKLKEKFGKDFSNSIKLIKNKNKELEKLLESQREIIASQIIIEKISENYDQWPLTKDNPYFSLDQYKDALIDKNLKFPIVSILIEMLQLQYNNETYSLMILKDKMKKVLTPSNKKLFPSLKETYSNDEFQTDQQRFQTGIKITDKQYQNIYNELMDNHELLDHFYDVLENLDFSWTSLPPEYYGLIGPQQTSKNIYLCHVQIKNTLYKFDW